MFCAHPVESMEDYMKHEKQSIRRYSKKQILKETVAWRKSVEVNRESTSENHSKSWKKGNKRKRSGSYIDRVFLIPRGDWTHKTTTTLTK